MQTVEFRVRPVVRHVVTRYHSETHADGMCSGGVETLGEFDSEGYAEIVQQALAERVAPREYVLVQDTVGEVMAKVFYAYDEKDVAAKLAEESVNGETYRVFSRIKSLIP